MGFLSGVLNIKRFFIENTDFFKDRESVVANLTNFIFKNIENSSSEESIGWVNPMKPCGTEIKANDIFFSNYIFLAMRHDVKKVSPLFLDLKVNQLIEKEDLEIKSNRDLKQLKEDVKNDLLKRSLPSSKIVDAVIDIKRSILLINSSSLKTCSLFLSLFEKTFAILPIFVDKTVFAHISTGSDGVKKLSELNETVIYDE